MVYCFYEVDRCRNGGGHGDAAMSRNQESHDLYDQGMIDDRNLRPLAIAFATILMAWMLVFGLVFVSAQMVTESHHLAASSGPAISMTVR
jgi:hypothetical protein